MLLAGGRIAWWGNHVWAQSRPVTRHFESCPGEISAPKPCSTTAVVCIRDGECNPRASRVLAAVVGDDGGMLTRDRHSGLPRMLSSSVSSPPWLSRPICV